MEDPETITHRNIEEAVVSTVIKSKHFFRYFIHMFRREGSMPNIKHGVKLPSINGNILYSPNYLNVNKAKIS